MNRTIALLVAAGLILLGLFYFRRNTQAPVAPAAIETQVDTTQDLAPQAEVAQEAAAQ